MKTMHTCLMLKKNVQDFKRKLKNVKKGDWTDKTFIEQIVMLVEKKKRQNIVVNVNNGFVHIIQSTDKNLGINVIQANKRISKECHFKIIR